MAITKILNINKAKQGNPAAHLENAIAYIQNPDKTEECVLVGSVNCLPDTAFSQMVDTKNLFSKIDKRQGYHIIISFPPGEATPEQAMEVTRRFVEEHLQGEYEAVYAVHTDKEHCHGHIIFNSVNMVTGEKYNSQKGNWKYHLQPLTNKFCQELGLSIMPAEYSKDPVNMSKEKWDYEQNFKDYILMDAKLCLAYAGNLEHFIFLMKRLGYEFKGKDYMSIRVPGMKLYHRLDKLDAELTQDNLKYWFGNGEYSYIPKYYSRKVPYIKWAKLTPLQKRYYAKMYRLGLVEKRRFTYHSAELAAEIKRMNTLQKEYLFLCDNNVQEFGNLLDVIRDKERQMVDISTKQQEIYKETAARKHGCKTPEDFKEYQLWHLETQKVLDDLKARKKALKEQIKTGNACLEENTAIAMGIVDASKELTFNNDLDVSEMLGFEKQEIAEEFGIGEKIEDTKNIVTFEQKVNTVDEVAYEDTNIMTVNGTDKMSIGAGSEYDDWNVVEEKIATERKAVAGENMTSDVVSEYMDDMTVDTDVISSVGNIRRKGATLEEEVALICDYIQKRYGRYGNMSVMEKADCFEFRADDISYDMKLHGEVLRRMNIKIMCADLYEDFQGIYDETMRKMEKENDREIISGLEYNANAEIKKTTERR